MPSFINSLIAWFSDLSTPDFIALLAVAASLGFNLFNFFYSKGYTNRKNRENRGAERAIAQISSFQGQIDVSIYKLENAIEKIRSMSDRGIGSVGNSRELSQFQIDVSTINREEIVVANREITSLSIRMDASPSCQECDWAVFFDSYLDEVTHRINAITNPHNSEIDVRAAIDKMSGVKVDLVKFTQEKIERAFGLIK